MRLETYVGTRLDPRFDERLDDSLTTKLFYVKLIAHAFYEARRSNPSTARPIPSAVEAWDWINDRQPSRYCAQPGTFEHACHVVGYDPETIRHRGLPQGAAFWEYTDGGIEAVRASWELPRRRNLASLTQRVLNFEESLL
jgi:hypothetical protein